ncbi:MAG: hypothetical protein ACFCVF_02510 [Kineosporiaceae bacterium]
MRWEALFADLEARLAAGDEAEFDAEVAERARHEVAAMSLADRLRAHAGRDVALGLSDGGHARGRVVGAGVDVVVLAGAGEVRCLVPLRAITVMSGLGPAGLTEASVVLSRLGLRHALGGLARARLPVRVATTHGEVAGVVHRVAADHIDVCRRVPGGDLDVSAIVDTVPLAAVVAVRSAV